MAEKGLIAWKDEGGVGPVWAWEVAPEFENGFPKFEGAFKLPEWFTINEAMAIAKNIGADFTEV